MKTKLCTARKAVKKGMTFLKGDGGMEEKSADWGGWRW
jgi:hypothetical protein